MKSDLFPRLDSEVGKVNLQKAWISVIVSDVQNSLYKDF